MADKMTEKELLAIYQTRKKDFEKGRTKRKRQLATHPQGMKNLLTSYFKSDSQTMRHIEENRVLIAWPKYIGKAAAGHAIAKRIRGNTLVVHVTDPLWMQQLSLLKNEFLRQIQRDFPGFRLRDIYFTRYDREEKPR